MTILKGWLCRKLHNVGCAFSAAATRFWCLFGVTRGESELFFQLSQIFAPS
jgi:hypothetical protein